MIKDLKRKLLIINLIIISVVMMISFTGIYFLTAHFIDNDNLERVNRHQLINFTNIRNPYQEKEIINNDISSFSLLTDENFNLTKILSSLDIVDDEYFEIVVNLDNHNGIIELDEKEWMYQISVLPRDTEQNLIGDSYYKINFIDITSSNQVLSTLLFMLITVGIVVMIVIYFISLYFANKSIKPVETIWKKQKQFVADATHELKTPLTIINANIDAIRLNGDDCVKNQSKWLDYIKYQTSGMNKLINELLISAKAEEDKYNITSVNLSEVIRNICLSFEAMIFENNIKLKTNIDDCVIIQTDENKIEQVIKILLDNAIKYNKEKGNITIKVYEVKKNVYIEVENSGQGIAPNDLPYIFDRFYKSDKSRSNNSYGLGLFIAKSIVNKLNGEISVVSEINKKTKFVIKFKI